MRFASAKVMTVVVLALRRGLFLDASLWVGARRGTHRTWTERHSFPETLVYT
jgi:hypothetical protein